MSLLLPHPAPPCNFNNGGLGFGITPKSDFLNSLQYLIIMSNTYLWSRSSSLADANIASTFATLILLKMAFSGKLPSSSSWKFNPSGSRPANSSSFSMDSSALSKLSYSFSGSMLSPIVFGKSESKALASSTLFLNGKSYCFTFSILVYLNSISHYYSSSSMSLNNSTHRDRSSKCNSFSSLRQCLYNNNSE